MYGKKLRELRKLEGWTQEQVAKKLGITKQTYSHYENENRKPSLNMIRELAAIYQVNIDDIFAEDDKKGMDSGLTNIPLVGTICAGDGLLAEQNIEEYIYYPFPRKRQPDFALRVKGDSMIGAGIEDGDIVYFKKATWADYNGQIVAALINDNEEGTLKRIRWSADSPLIRLEPENDEYEVIEVRPNEVHICGVYMGHFREEQEV
ncbi:S24 family peptidase [Thermobacillus sp.]|uniref:LexA family protein n=1 Tax=Thermobacillus sp. TaxID=2108467 RepID=UPI00257E07C5|nr:S24 family peptidase [Thermobacillus sp.]